MRQALVYNHGRLAGVLTEKNPTQYRFVYDEAYFKDPVAPPISLTLPKTRQVYQAAYLFPFFSNMLSEGDNRHVQAKIHKLDPEDDFGFLLCTAGVDTPGAVTVKPMRDDTV